jgi:hypothetical protein
MDIPNISEQILKLEESLLHEDFSSNPEALEAMISNDFREIDPKGRECSREDVIAWLLQKNPASRSCDLPCQANSTRIIFLWIQTLFHLAHHLSFHKLAAVFSPVD